MPDILYAAALDKQLYQDTQLTVATAQNNTQNTLRQTKNTTLQCCICCHCCCLACIEACKQPTDPNNLIQEAIRYEPGNLTNWQKIPNQHGNANWNTFCIQCVWPNGGTWGQCGATCAWTVPSNVDCVQFDMWGPGGPSWGHECCGGSLYGSTGSFISVTMPTQAGDIFCLVAGCAICCNPMGPNNAGNFYMPPGGATTVCSCTSGVNVCLCAISGPSNMRTMRHFNQTMPVWCYNMGGCGNYSQAGCWCSGGSFCMNGCATCSSSQVGWGNFHYKPSINIDNSRGGASTDYSAFWLYPMYGTYCWDTNFYGCYTHPPVARWSDAGAMSYNWESCNLKCMSWSSGNCCGGLCCGAPSSGYCPPPGSGGMGLMVKSGVCRCGNAGKGGMVRVTYHTT